MTEGFAVVVLAHASLPHKMTNAMLERNGHYLHCAAGTKLRFL